MTALWPTVSLTDVLEFREGPGILAIDFRETGVPLIRLAGLKRDGDLLSGCNFLDPDKVERRWKQFRLRLGDVLLSTSASLGEVAVVDDSAVNAIPYTGLISFRPRDSRVSPEFIPLMLREKSFKDQIEAMGVGSVMKHFGPSHLRSMSVTLPPLSEQQAIAEVLGALDDKIAANIRLAATADELIGTLYRHAQSTGTRDVALLDEFDVTYGEPFAGSSFSDPDVGRPLIRIRDLKTYDSQVWTTESRPRETVVQPGDVLVGMDAEFRATPWLGKPGLLNQRVCRFTHSQWGNALVREAVRQPLAEVENEKSATTVIHLNKSDLARKSARLPLAESAQDFERVAEPLYGTIVTVAEECRSLAATRDTLLPKLMSGQLRVKKAEKILSEVGV